MAVGGGRTELLASEVFEEMLLKSKGMNALSFETEASRWDGSKFPAQLSITVRRIQGDGFFAVFVRDLTSVRKQETLLRSERQRSDELLYTIVPRPIAVRLKRGEKPIYDEYSCISIIFIDLVGFTSMSSKMSARDLIVLLSDYFSTIDRIAATHSVEKVKLIGDCFLGMAGLYSRFNDHAQAMVEFAQDVMLMLNDFNQKHGTTLNCRIGINSGPCMVGVIGETKFQLDAYGDTVNIASRMESTGVPGRIQLSRNTYELVCDQVGCEERGTIQVKGKGDMVTYLVK
jgi:class 3 adenylate cyclase